MRKRLPICHDEKVFMQPDSMPRRKKGVHSPDNEQLRAVGSKTCPPSEAARENVARECVRDKTTTSNSSPERKRPLVLSSCGPL
jgi:hypothetical protein